MKQFAKVVATPFGNVYFGSTALLHGEGPNVTGLRFARKHDGQPMNKGTFVALYGEAEYQKVELWAETERA